MGIDLSLAIDGYELKNNLLFPKATLILDRDYELFDLVKECRQFPLAPQKLYHHEDDGLKERIEDAYGYPLMYTYSGDLADLLTLHAALDAQKMTHWNRGVVKLLQELLPDTKIVLWWH